MRRILACCVILISAAAFAQQAEKTNLQKLQEQQRKQIEQNYRRYKEVPGKFKMSEVCRLRNEKGKWRMETNLPAGKDYQQNRVNVEGLDGIVLVSLGPKRNDLPDNFSLNYHDFSNPQALQVTTSISVNYGGLNINRHAQMLSGGYSSVQFNQGQQYDDFGRMMPNSTIVTLSANISDETGVGTSFTVQAPDFTTLVRRHGEQVDRYLRPVLRDLHMESVLAADIVVARQVLADDMIPDRDAAASVKQLLAGLDADKFTEREDTARKLAELGPAMALAVHHLDRATLSGQQCALLDAVTAAYRPRPEGDIPRLRNDISFLLDCLYCDDEAIRVVAARRLWIKSGFGADFDIKAPFEKRVDMIEAVRKQAFADSR